MEASQSKNYSPEDTQKIKGFFSSRSTLPKKSIQQLEKLPSKSAKDNKNDLYFGDEQND